MKKYILPRKTLLLWQIRAVIFGILIFLAVLAARSFISFPARLIVIFGIIDLISVFLIAIFYMPALFKSSKVILLKQGAVVERGVFFKNTHILPFSKLIYTQTYRSPLASRFGLMAVSLKAARSRVFIPEMNRDDANELIIALSEGEDQ